MPGRSLPVDLDACGRYALRCQTAEGGFCFYADPTWGAGDANAPDTAAAIEILARRGLTVPRAGPCAAWLQSLQDADGGYPTLLVGCSALRALRLLQAAPRRDPRPYLRGWLASFQPCTLPARMPGGWLAAAARCVEGCLAEGVELAPAARAGIRALLQRTRHEAGGHGLPGPNLPDTARASMLSRAAGLAPDEQALGFARRCEHGAFGFNVTPWAGSSSLETQLAGLTVLQAGGERPVDAAPIQAYVATCQTSRGGFARAPGAIARLDDSLRALQILSMLDACGP